ncbi:host attachment protein [Rhodovulum sp. 12E13]|uniref:baeRF12 domain-containing protein n=1 Tax=Rhodovulum sp. 12E13 TaxID=2203891 RepID=UPI0026CA7E6E
MADRKRSRDGAQETQQYLESEPATPGHQGRAEGDLERQVGTRDEHKRATASRPGATRVTKEDEEGEGNLGGLHGTGPRPPRRGRQGPWESDVPQAAVLTHGTWILVADSEKALFLRNETDAENPNFVVVGKEEQENPATSEQGTDRPGRMQDTGVQQRSGMEDTDWHRLAKERFAHDLADRLYDLAHKGAFDRIVLVAAPRVLGALRDQLHKEVKGRVVGEVDRNLTHEPVDAIERHVAGALTRG